MPSAPAIVPYRGRLAPSPTGYLHLGHARTFWIAQQRAQRHGGALVLRNEDLDRGRSKPEFVTAMLEDLHWFGFQWQEGPDCGGPYGPYSQSERLEFYRAAFDKLRAADLIYSCTCSRQDVLQALQAPHAGEDEPIYPGTCRSISQNAAGVAPSPWGEGRGEGDSDPRQPKSQRRSDTRFRPHTTDKAARINWRFRVSEGEVVSFNDGHYGPQTFVAGRDFGDFVVWRHDDLPSYQLAVVVDDAAMAITEVVRGEDLLRSTARQLLLYKALGLSPPKFYHCPLVTDEAGARLAKRHAALSLRTLRANGAFPEALRKSCLI